VDKDYYGPELYVKELVRAGGLNPYGLPLFRLVLIGKRTCKLAFQWEDWPDDVPYEQRHGIVTNPDTGKPVESPWRPLQTKIEMREVIYYHDQNPEEWLIERWWPPFESREAWFAPNRCVNGNPDLPKSGPYPDEGAYLFVAGTFEKPPELGMLLDLIAMWAKNRESMERDAVKYTKQQEEIAQWNYEQRAAKKLAESEAHIKDLLSPITTMSLGAGRWRQQMYERAGFRGHIGN
jgi:hypothetical protein